MSSPLRNVQPSARVRLATRLYATGACRTKKEASAAAGLHPNYLTMLTSRNNGSVPVMRLLNDIDEKIEDQTIQTSAILALLGRKAIGKLSHLMDSPNEHVALKAAVDLADRSPETSKTQKVQVDSFSLSGQDVKDLAAAMVESAKASSKYLHVTEDGLDEVGLDEPVVITPKELPSAEEPINEQEADGDHEASPTEAA